MNSKTTQVRAVVLAGGKGTRLAPYTRIIPKPLMPIGDMPILEIMLRQMRRAGIRQVTLTTGYLDNLLRPRLVGKDTEMHDLFVLFGTLGGISMFGLLGIILGPIVAALFITIWEIYGETFKKYLPRVGVVLSKHKDGDKG